MNIKAGRAIDFFFLNGREVDNRNSQPHTTYTSIFQTMKRGMTSVLSLLYSFNKTGKVPFPIICTSNLPYILLIHFQQCMIQTILES